jgi:hypothetical protein
MKDLGDSRKRSEVFGLISFPTIPNGLQNIHPRDGKFDAADVKGGFFRGANTYGADDKELTISGLKLNLSLFQCLFEKDGKLFLNL